MSALGGTEQERKGRKDGELELSSSRPELTPTSTIAYEPDLFLIPSTRILSNSRLSNPLLLSSDPTQTMSAASNSSTTAPPPPASAPLKPYPISSNTLPYLSLFFLLPIWFPSTSMRTVYVLCGCMVLLCGPLANFVKKREDAIVEEQRQRKKDEDEAFLKGL